MSKASARDLLRRTREQKKQQHGSSRTEHNRLVEITKHDSFARVSANGTLHCNVCSIQIKPSDPVGWSVHKKSRRHQQNIPASSANSPPNSTNQAKRSHDEAVVGPDVSENLAQRLTIGQKGDDAGLDLSDEQLKRQIETKRRKVGKLDTYDSDKDSEEMQEQDQLCENTTDGEPVADQAHKASSGDVVSEFVEIPDLPVSSLEYTSKASLNKEKLADSLAAFESEIAGLSEPTKLADVDEDNDAPHEPAEGPDSQTSVWVGRTHHLARLHSIIKEGVKEMDPDEDADKDGAMSEASSETSSGDEAYSKFVNWRAGQL